MKDEYSKNVMDHFLHPRNVGEIEDADGIGEFGNPTCGDILRLHIKVENERIVDIKFQTFGCGAAIASGSILTEIVKGKTIDEALNLTNKEVADALGGLPKPKIHCSVMAEKALRSAIESYKNKQAGKSSP